jgi:hypothetical protein
MHCPHCSANTPKDAQFCPQCGNRFVSSRPLVTPLAPSHQGWSTLVFSLGLSIGLSLLLTLVFHLPIFILGAVLPLFWMGRRGLR